MVGIRSSRRVVVIVDTILLALTTSFSCFAAAGHLQLGNVEGKDDHTSQGFFNSQSSWFGKRMSQMSCHCCSNSFNSHCCLQCMRSVGKRSELSASTSHFDNNSEENFQDKTSAENAVVNGAANGWTTESLVCFCCILQMSKHSSERWACCDRCPDLYRWTDKWSLKEKDMF